MRSSIVVGGLSVSRRGLRGVGVAALMLGFGVCAASAGPVATIAPAGGSGATSRVVAPGAIYSNVTNFLHYGVTVSGVSGPGNDDFTPMTADDLTLAGGGAVSEVNVYMFNDNSGTVTANVDMTFYANDGTSGLAGTVLGAFQLPGVSIQGGDVVSELGVAFSPGQLTLSGGTIWAGLAYDNANQPNTSDAELTLLGDGLFNPPDVGSSTDEVELMASGQAPYTSNDPSGGTTNFGGNPVANVGWEIVVTPEPGCLGVILFGLALMRRRARGE
jgi:hypothetical protein